MYSAVVEVPSPVFSRERERARDARTPTPVSADGTNGNHSRLGEDERDVSPRPETPETRVSPWRLLSDAVAELRPPASCGDAKDAERKRAREVKRRTCRPSASRSRMRNLAAAARASRPWSPAASPAPPASLRAPSSSPRRSCATTTKRRMRLGRRRERRMKRRFSRLFRAGRPRAAAGERRAPSQSAVAREELAAETKAAAHEVKTRPQDPQDPQDPQGRLKRPQTLKTLRPSRPSRLSARPCAGDPRGVARDRNLSRGRTSRRWRVGALGAPRPASAPPRAVPRQIRCALAAASPLSVRVDGEPHACRVGEDVSSPLREIVVRRERENENENDGGETPGRPARRAVGCGVGARAADGPGRRDERVRSRGDDAANVGAQAVAPARSSGAGVGGGVARRPCSTPVRSSTRPGRWRSCAARTRGARSRTRAARGSGKGRAEACYPYRVLAGVRRGPVTACGASGAATENGRDG